MRRIMPPASSRLRLRPFLGLKGASSATSFSGGAALGASCAEHGWFMSFAGTVTFKANEHLRAALAVAPADLLLVETDAPFLAPLPFRGRPNASYLIPVTLAAMAGVRETSVEDLALTVSKNTERAFGAW